MKDKVTKEDMKWLVSLGVLLVAGIWAIVRSDFTRDNLMNHIKFFYCILLFLAISGVAYMVVFKLKSKKEKENGSKKK
jgi:hypothetical protein